MTNYIRLTPITLQRRRRILDDRKRYQSPYPREIVVKTPLMPPARVDTTDKDESKQFAPVSGIGLRGTSASIIQGPDGAERHSSPRRRDGRRGLSASLLIWFLRNVMSAALRSPWLTCGPATLSTHLNDSPSAVVLLNKVVGLHTGE